MERLTERLENGVINVKYASQHETAIHRLAAIEDILGEEYDLDRLRELVQADREGRCVVLPVPLHKTLRDVTDMTVQDGKTDKQLWYTKAKLDERLKQIYGEHFRPWEERYK